MRKTITQPVSKDTSRSSERWLNLDHLAQVEVTSEEAANPVESALIPGPGAGWRAEQPGEQSIQLIFDQPLSLRLIHLRFDEPEVGTWVLRTVAGCPVARSIPEK